MRTVGVRFVADVTQFKAGVGQAASSVKQLSGDLDKASKAGKLDKVADQAARFGLIGVAAFAGVVKASADFDKQMSAVSAATHASTGDMAKLRAAALQAGKDTQYSATQAAQGITELSKAGVSTADVLSGGLRGALSLAAAGQLDVGEAAETAASAMTQFKLKGDQIPHVADLLAAGAGKAQGSVHDLSAALGQSGLIAAQTGLSIEDTTGTLAAFASAGLLGSDAGTSFKTMLQALQAPSSKSADLMKSLGISAYDASGNFVGITALAGQLRTQLGKLTPELRANALAQIFGSDATRAASVLYEQGAAGIQTWIDKTNDAGYAAKTAAKLTDNLAGDLERLKGSLETMAISAGSGANTGIRGLTKGLNALVNGFAQLPPAVSSSVTVLAGLAGVGALGLAGFIKVRQGIASAVTQLNAMGPAGEKAAVGLGKTASAAGKVAAAFAVLQVAGAIISSFQTQLNPQIDAAAKGLEEWARQCLLSGEAARLFGADSKDLDRALRGLADHGFSHATDAATDWVLGIAGVSSPLDDAKAKADALDQALAAMVKAGHSAEALGYLEQRAKATGVSVDDLKKLLPAFSGALETAGTAAGTAAAGTKKYATATAAAAGAAKGERTALEDLATALQAQFSPVLALIAAQKDFKVKEDAAAEAVKKHGRNSKEARAASLDLAGAALNLTGKVGALGDSFNGKLSPAMRTALKNAGLTKKQINDVEGAFKTAKTAGDKFAKPYQAKVSVTGDAAAMVKLRALNIMQNALRKGVSISTSAARSLAGDAAAAKDRGVFAGGGPVPGYSPHKKADNIPAWLTAREYVQPVDAVDYYGVPAMDAIRRRQVPRDVLAGFATGALGKMGDLPIFAAAGGLVWPYPTTASRTRIPSWTEAAAVVGGPGAAFVRAQDGKPYIWAAAGPGGYDCSGIVSAVYNVLHGKNPYSHTFSTGSLPGRWFPKSGIGGPLTAAWSNPGQYPASSTTGHMMGMVGGLTFESSGSRGVHLGASTRRLSDFAHIAHYDRGGVITEPIIGAGASGTLYSFGEGYRHERVSPMGGGDGGVINVTVQAGYVVTPQQLEDKLAYTIDTLRRKGRV